MTAVMSFVSLFLILFGLVGTGPIGRAQSPDGQLPWLSRDAAFAAVVGHRMDGIYADGKPWSELADTDGSTVLTEDGHAIAGRWHFDDQDNLCYAYVGEDAPFPGCFRFVRLSANCLEQFFQETEGELTGEWVTNGYLWRASEPSTCDERSTS